MEIEVLSTKTNDTKPITYLERKLLVYYEGQRYYITEERWLKYHPIYKKLPEKGVMYLKGDKYIIVKNPTDESCWAQLIQLLES